MHIPKPVTSLLSPRKNETVLRLTIALAVLACFGLLFGNLADEVIEKDTLYADEAVLKYINGLSTPLLDNVMVFLTSFGGVLAVMIASTILAALYARRRNWRASLFITFSIGGLLLVNSILKLFYQRERPELWDLLVNEATYSFPSGHSALSFGLAAIICLLLWRSRWRWITVGISAAYIMTIGFTRLYLGVHYPTDVLAGWLLAIIWIGAVGVLSGIISIEGIKRRLGMEPANETNGRA